MLQSTSMVTDENGNPAIRYKDTNVVTFHSDGSVTLRSDGWHTHTTKKRINNGQAVCRVYQEDFVWYVATQNADGSLDWDAKIEFRDGMRVYPGGKVEYQGG